MDESLRPWGFYEILSDMDDHKVKRITIYAGKRLSLQRHSKRDEHWFILRGRGIITLNENISPAEEGMSFNVPAGVLHRLENSASGEMVLIEVQTGAYFGEDDIERIEDDYGRI